MEEKASLADTQKVVALNAFILRQHGFALGKDARILDLGCGSGRHTYEYRDAGYRNAAGFDIRDYVELRRDSDRRHFHFLAPGETFALPFPDNYFDFVTSTTVFEHVLDQPRTIAEIARVLKRGGVTLHIFPSRWRPIECHIYVPLAGVIQVPWWFRIWAHLGIRNGYQKGLGTEAVVERNIRFCENKVHYPPFRELDANWRASFGTVIYAERAFVEGSKAVSTVSRLMSRLARFLPFAMAAYRGAHTRAVLAADPR